MALSASDRDLITRTALGEAGDGDDHAAIVQDILDRGGNPGDAVLARGAYPSWDKPRNNLRIDSKSPKYKKVAQLVDSMTDAPQPGSVLGRFGFDKEGTPLQSKSTAAPEAPIEPGSVLKLFGHDINAESATPPPTALPSGASGYVEMPGSGTRLYVNPQGQYLPGQETPTPNALAGVGQFASELPGRIGTATSEAFTGARALTQSGREDISAGRPATGVGKMAFGLAGQPMSLISGPLNVLAQEIDKLTGAPGTGEKAELFAPALKVGKVIEAVRPSSNALKTLIGDIGESNLPKVINRLESNPSLSLMDVAPGVQTRAIGIAKGESSAGQTHLFESAEQRTAERRGQTAEAYGATIGSPPNTVELLKQINRDAQTRARAAFEGAFQDAGQVDISPVLAKIDEKLKPGAMGVISEGQPVSRNRVQDTLAEYRNMMANENGQIFDARRLHEIQSEMGTEAHNLITSATGSDRKLGYELKKVQDQLVTQIDAATGGKYRPARELYRSDKQIPEAFKKGMDITSTARTGEAGLENRPEAWREWMSGATDAEQRAAQLGARTVIDNHIGTIRQAGRAGTDIPDAPFTRAKLEMLFGKPETDRLVQLLADEKAKAETNALLTKQSVTARALAAQKETAPRVVEPIGAHAQRLLPAAVLEAVQAPFTGVPGLATLGLMGYGVTRKAAQFVGRSRDIATNDAYARYASTVHPEERNALISVLRSRQAPVGYGNKVTNALRTMGTLPFAQ